MKALITGANGFIGSSLITYLQDRGYALGCVIRNDNSNIQFDVVKEDSLLHHVGDRVFQGDLTDSKFVKYVYEDFKPNIVYHLAANPMVKKDENNPHQIIYDNILATQNMCEYAIGCPRFIFASSVVVYGNKDHRVNENDYCSPTSLYAVSKLAGEGIINAYNEEGKINGVSLRLCATVGNRLTHGIIYDFIRKVQSDSEHLECFGDAPGSTKPFCHIDDVCKAMHLISRLLNQGTYNVVPYDEINVEKVARTVMKALEIIKPIKFLGEKTVWKGDNKVIQCSNKRLVYRGWTPKYETSSQAIYQAVLNNVS